MPDTMQRRIITAIEELATGRQLTAVWNTGVACNMGHLYIQDGFSLLLDIACDFQTRYCVLEITGPAADAWRATAEHLPVVVHGAMRYHVTYGPEPDGGATITVALDAIGGMLSAARPAAARPVEERNDLVHAAGAVEAALDGNGDLIDSAAHLLSMVRDHLRYLVTGAPSGGPLSVTADQMHAAASYIISRGPGGSSCTIRRVETVTWAVTVFHAEYSDGARTAVAADRWGNCATLPDDYEGSLDVVRALHEQATSR